MLNRMNLIVRHYNSRQAHGGHCHLALGSCRVHNYTGDPIRKKERGTKKCHTYMTAPVHSAFSCCSLVDVKRGAAWSLDL
jgi:hypothetical protein